MVSHKREQRNSFGGGSKYKDSGYTLYVSRYLVEETDAAQVEWFMKIHFCASKAEVKRRCLTVLDYQETDDHVSDLLSTTWAWKEKAVFSFPP